MLSICIFGLSGLPPTAGFLAKLNLFVAAWSKDTTMSRTLAMVLALNAVIAAAYYLKTIGLMYFEKSQTVVDAEPRSTSSLAGLICSVSTLLLFLKPQWLWDAAAAAIGMVTT
jgi:NADH-quinone oxidoreductase subunit N